MGQKNENISLGCNVIDCTWPKCEYNLRCELMTRHVPLSCPNTGDSCRRSDCKIGLCWKTIGQKMDGTYLGDKMVKDKIKPVFDRMLAALRMVSDHYDVADVIKEAEGLGL